VTRLRKMMLEELERRNYSAGTTRRYLRFVERFAQHFHKSPDKLGPDHLRSYQAYLLTELKLCRDLSRTTWPHCGSSSCARCRRHEFREFLPYPKSPRKLPQHSQPGRSRTADRRQHESVSAHAADGALRNRHAPLRTRPAQDRSHRQPAHDHPRCRWQGTQGSRPASEPDPAREPACLLATAQAAPPIWFPVTAAIADHEQPITDKTVWLACTGSSEEGRHPQESFAAPGSPRVGHALARSRHRPAHHPASARP